MKHLFLIGWFFFYASALLGQTWSQDTLYFGGSRVKIPIPAVDTLVTPVYLLASPLKPSNTPGNKRKTGDWSNLDFHNDVDLSYHMESLFVRTQRFLKQLGSYDFYYKGAGDPLSEEEFKTIRFTKFPAFLKILEPYKIAMPPRKGRKLFEVYRWQHPNLHVVAYDKERGGYYRYRIALVLYSDPEHPEAFVIH